MCIVFLSTLATQPLKAQAQETITGNFLAAIPNIGHGLHGLGLGLSRLALDGSQRLAATEISVPSIIYYRHRCDGRIIFLYLYLASD